MPSGKRETESKGNAPVITCPSPNSDGRANNLVEEAYEPARISGPLHFQSHHLNGFGGIPLLILRERRNVEASIPSFMGSTSPDSSS
ncbi:hypothetical protein T01_2250 [Trichinella spiralis]|uniref:Uncharacterized protein n=1 Tax=Trichinella spiralis TaxID=6334 RepID=A0A0V1C150_TRISP|nr:hypothetical protein T01_2250 [Trichinella spiralis]